MKMGPFSFLFIHYHYPPIRNSGVYRNYYLSTAITKIVGKTYLITTDNRKYLPNELLDLHPDINRKEAFTIDYRKFIGWIKGSQAQAGAQFSEEKKNSFISKWLIKIQRSFPFNLFLSEGAIFYIINGFFIGNRLIKEKKVNTIFSSFMPYSDHIIAFLLKKKHPDIKWIADFRDLQVEPIYKNTIWVPFQYWIENKILARADLVTCVSEGISKKMRALHSNVMTLTKGVSVRPKKEKYNKFTISYSGSLFLDFRDPGSIFHHIKTLIDQNFINANHFQFVYAGKDGVKMKNWAVKQGIGDIFIDKGYISHEAAKEIQDRSHINLLLTSASVEHQGLLTGKFFEYIEAGNPIICMVNGGVMDLEIQSMFEKYNLGYVFWNRNEDSISLNILEKWYQEWQINGEIRFEMNEGLILRELGWNVQAHKLISAIQ